ncbi:MAG: hypothetical protein K8H88_08165, partial [Sandaracinaceae bacterium]|nr:hypothetical protein [Sandaracinaceae bacterium]
FDRASGRPIEATVRLDELRPRANADQQDVARAVRGRREVVHLPVRTRAEARARAREILRNNDRGMIVGRGETFGLPGLRAGEHLRLTNLGPRFSGLYYVLETTHSIGDDGYRTQFKARREGPLEDAPAGAGS